MPNLSGSTILIVGDTPDVADLRARLVESGATVHVVSVAGASLLVHQKQIDSAFIAANLDESTQRLCAELELARPLPGCSSHPSAQRCSRRSWLVSLRTYVASCGRQP